MSGCGRALATAQNGNEPRRRMAMGRCGAGSRAMPRCEPCPRTGQLPSRGTVRNGMGSVAGDEPSRLLQALRLHPGCRSGRAACGRSVGREGRVLGCALRPRSSRGAKCRAPAMPRLARPRVILSSLLSLLAPCRTRHGESRQRLRESGRPTVAAGSVPALPTQQMLIQIRI